MKARFPIYEIEHQGDEQSALEDLAKAGCTDIKVVSRNFLEGDGDDESMRVECNLPEGMKHYRELEAISELCL